MRSSGRLLMPMTMIAPERRSRNLFDLIVTLDDATSEIYPAFLVEEEGTLSSFRGGWPR